VASRAAPATRHPRRLATDGARNRGPLRAPVRAPPDFVAGSAIAPTQFRGPPPTARAGAGRLRRAGGQPHPAKSPSPATPTPCTTWRRLQRSIGGSPWCCPQHGTAGRGRQGGGARALEATVIARFLTDSKEPPVR